MTNSLTTKALNVEPAVPGTGVPAQDADPPGGVPLTNAELAQLRIRVIALENLVIALLAQAPDQQLALARRMAAYISPREGCTPHPVTLRAAAEMLSLVERAGRYPHPWTP
jgi:hypothetical protein